MRAVRGAGNSAQGEPAMNEVLLPRCLLFRVPHYLGFLAQEHDVGDRELGRSRGVPGRRDACS